MKRFIIILLALVPLGAFAQNRAIEELAKKYSDRKGFSSTVIKGSISSGFLPSSMNMDGVDISKIIKNISSIIVVISDEPNEEFTRDVKRAVDAVNYSVIASSSSNGENIRFLLAVGDGKKDKKSEFVIVISGSLKNLLVSVVGHYNVKEIMKTDDN